MNSPAAIPDSAVSKRPGLRHLDSTMYEASAEMPGAGNKSLLMKDEEQEVEIKIQAQAIPQRMTSREPSRTAIEKSSPPNEESELGTRKVSCEDVPKSATQLLSRMAPAKSLEVRKIAPERKTKKKETPRTKPKAQDEVSIAFMLGALSNKSAKIIQSSEQRHSEMKQNLDKLKSALEFISHTTFNAQMDAVK